MRGEENGESSKKEKSKHGGYEDPIGKEVAYADGECGSAATTATDCNRHSGDGSLLISPVCIIITYRFNYKLRCRSLYIIVLCVYVCVL